jgi:crotonobetainyl-CoA:carnitine CoA-transferase CaiB-like acyl-CoA transferase
MMLSLSPGSLDTPAPLLGEHNSHVLKSLIGLTDDEYMSLEEDGVLE